MAKLFSDMDHAVKSCIAREGLEPWESELKELQAMRELVAQKDGAYAERDKLVAHLSYTYPSSLERHPDTDTSWDDDWRWIVFIDLPTGQASWHIHDSELSLFDHLPRFAGRVWDGHTTLEKYDRLAAIRAPETT